MWHNFQNLKHISLKKKKQTWGKLINIPLWSCLLLFVLTQIVNIIRKELIVNDELGEDA